MHSEDLASALPVNCVLPGQGIEAQREALHFDGLGAGRVPERTDINDLTDIQFPDVVGPEAQCHQGDLG